MDTSRRQFLVGLASGLILPKFYDWTRNYVERTGEAPLMKVKDPQIILKANISIELFIQLMLEVVVYGEIIVMFYYKIY